MRAASSNKVLIATSFPVDSRGLECALQGLSGIEMAGSVACSEDLFDTLRLEHVRCLVIDFTSSGFSIDDIRNVKRKHPGTNVVAYTAEEGARTMGDALKAGLHGYVKRDCDIREIQDCVSAVAHGERFFCSQVLRKVNLEVIDSNQENSCAGIELSERELEIIAMIAEGYTNAQIADILCLSAHTVNTHRRNIMAKLGVNNTAAIVMFAVKSELVSPNKFLFANG